MRALEKGGDRASRKEGNEEEGACQAQGNRQAQGSPEGPGEAQGDAPQGHKEDDRQEGDSSQGCKESAGEAQGHTSSQGHEEGRAGEACDQAHCAQAHGQAALSAVPPHTSRRGPGAPGPLFASARGARDRVRDR
ncbi:MAG TPA: hypothetical protein VKE42_00195 [Candidatus Cybelea sp.]|nr:hypothetical protein [Candidatus Cybelea sp.]